MAAAVTIGSLNICSHFEKGRLLVIITLLLSRSYRPPYHSLTKDVHQKEITNHYHGLRGRP